MTSCLLAAALRKRADGSDLALGEALHDPEPLVHMLAEDASWTARSRGPRAGRSRRGRRRPGRARDQARGGHGPRAPARPRLSQRLAERISVWYRKLGASMRARTELSRLS